MLFFFSSKQQQYENEMKMFWLKPRVGVETLLMQPKLEAERYFVIKQMVNNAVCTNWDWREFDTLSIIK